MLKIGLTGGIGTGKSTVANLLSEMGIKVVDADKLGHAFYAKGERGFDVIIEQFGDAIKDSHGEIDRNKLRQIMFVNSSARRKLEQLIWSFIKQQIIQIGDAYLNSDVDVLVVEAALLFEAGWASMFDRIWVVEAPTEMILQRNVNTGRTHHQLESSMQNQLNSKQRIKMAEMFDGPLTIIWNDSDIGKLRQKTLEAMKEIL